MKTITFFHPVDDNYGASNILTYVLSFLSKEYKCIVYVPKITKKMSSTLKELHSDSVIFKECPQLPIAHRAMLTPKGLLSWVVKNILIIKLFVKIRKNTDIIYINTLSLFSLSFISRVVFKKNLLHCHEYLEGTPHGKIMRLFTYLFSHCIICVSEKVKNYISVKNASKYYIVRNGIPDITNNSKVLLSKEKDKVFISFIGRVMPEKGHWLVADAVSKLPKKLKNRIEIHVFGDAPPLSSHLFKDYQTVLLEKKLTNSIILKGFDANAAKKSYKYDACLVPSIIVDSFPTTVLEAMRAQKAVITTNNGGALELIEDKIDGFLISPNDPQALADLFAYCIKNKNDLANMGLKARSKYLNTYTITQFQKRFSEVFKQHA